MCSLPVCLLLLLLSAAACNTDVTFEQNAMLAHQQWERDNAPRFTVHIDQINQPYDLWVNIRHNNSYPYNNLVFTVTQKHALLPDTSYAQVLTLTKKDGDWIGQSAANLYFIAHPVASGFIFRDTGAYTLSVEHRMQDRILHGITNIGIKLIKKP